MADRDGPAGGARFASSVPARQPPFPLKGCGALDWGMQSRLARIFRPDTCRTVMLAIDHGYFQGPTTGLERVDLSILPLLPYADALPERHPAGDDPRGRGGRPRIRETR
jgi:3-hydroxy-5-phosphonooxypentane-2,4-dione thiolase